jgi:hypothetical protein
MTSKHWILKGTLALAAVTGAAGCEVHTTGYVRRPTVAVHAEVRTPPPPSATVTVRATPTVSSGVQVVEVSCAVGSQESCNGLDDNCDGRIDEGCGYQSGNIQITLHWNTGADIDMYVTDPMNETIYYGDTTSSSGGVLDQDARGNCRTDQPNPTIENVYWNAPNPPSGSYRVQLHYWGECNSGAGATLTTLSIAVGGQIIGAYNYTLMPQQRVDVASFQIP